MSDNQAVLDFLEKHGQIDDTLARYHIGTTAIRSRISDLNKLLEGTGRHIRNIWQTVPKRNGKKARVALYQLEDV